MKRYVVVVAQTGDIAHAARVVYAMSREDAQEVINRLSQGDFQWTDEHNHAVACGSGWHTDSIRLAA